MTRGIFRIRLGGVRAQEGDEKGRPIDYIMVHKDNHHNTKTIKGSQKVYDIEKKRKELKSTIDAQCRKAKEEVDKYSVPEEEGPYADLDGELEAFAKKIGGEDIFDTAEHIIDIIRPADTSEREVQYPRHHTSDIKFAVNEDMIYPESEGLVTAGKLLTEMYGTHEDEVSGALYTLLGNTLEPLLISVGVLRKLGYPAYPAMAQARMGEEMELVPTMIIAVLQPESDNPLITFTLLRSHPVVEAVDIISDEAMLGAAYAIKAANDGKILALDMQRRVEETNKVIPEEEVLERAKPVGETLCECGIRWEDSPAVVNTRITIAQYIFNAVINSETIVAVRERIAKAKEEVKKLDMLMLKGDRTMETKRKRDAFQEVVDNPESILNDPYFERDINMMANVVTEKYLSHIIHYMGLKYAKEKANDG
jgi:hypothetical protein